MRKILKSIFFVSAIALSTGAALAQSSALIGDWSSVDAANGALKGTFVFNKNHSMQMHPEGQPEFQGTWDTQDKDLILLVPEAGGAARMRYSVSKGMLTLTYENGNIQHFKRPSTKTPVKKVTKK